jgi:hypothetical protein
MLKRLSLALALLAAASLVISPVAPAYAASMKSAKAKTEWIASHAKKGNIAILSTQQMRVLAVTNPRLHAKLWAAYQKSSVPKLTRGERKYVAAVTTKNLDRFIAGSGGAEWIVVAVIIAVILLFLWAFGLGWSPFHSGRRRRVLHRRQARA